VSTERLTAPRLPKDGRGSVVHAMTAQEIVEVIMLQHWDMVRCYCWICTYGRASGCRLTNAAPLTGGPGQLARVGSFAKGEDWEWGRDRGIDQ